MRLHLAVMMLVLSITYSTSAQPKPIEIGNRRELFVEETLIDSMTNTELRLHKPKPQSVVIVHDEPWEGSGSGYHSVFQDGDLYRLYYKAWQLDVMQGKVNTGSHPLYCCYAESKDGIHWKKPNLGLHEFKGSKENNIAMISGKFGNLSVDAGHPAVFKDENPNAAADAKYKAILRSSGKNGLIVFKSPDAIHWSPLSKEPILSGLGAFDSQNLAFWDPNIKKYRAYWRIFTAGTTNEKKWKPAGYRAIRTAVSDDLIHWTDQFDLQYTDSPDEHLYTNQIKPYYRAPHILIGFPERYIDRGWSKSMEKLPQLENRKMRSSASRRYGTAITEGLLMASRDGHTFKRWNEAFLPAGYGYPDNWKYGDNYIAWHVVETKSPIPGQPNELSLYASEDYWTGKSNRLRRYTLRLDGFVSAHAGGKVGQLKTKPLIFEGSELTINFKTSAAGGIRIELQSEDGKTIPGYSLADCPVIFGDDINRIVEWKNGSNVASLAGRPVRLLIELKDADLYSFQFRGE